jgi:hypothetical protein
MDPRGVGALVGAIVTFVVIAAVVQVFWVAAGAVGGAATGWFLRWLFAVGRDEPDVVDLVAAEAELHRERSAA